jgi:hypothetical protein
MIPGTPVVLVQHTPAVDAAHLHHRPSLHYHTVSHERARQIATAVAKATLHRPVSLYRVFDVGTSTLGGRYWLELLPSSLAIPWCLKKAEVRSQE